MAIKRAKRLSVFVGFLTRENLQTGRPVGPLSLQLVCCGHVVMKVTHALSEARPPQWLHRKRGGGSGGLSVLSCGLAAVNRRGLEIEPTS